MLFSFGVGEISLKRFTASATAPMVDSISSAVFALPKENLRVPWANNGSRAIAFNTCEGSLEPELSGLYRDLDK